MRLPPRGASFATLPSTRAACLRSHRQLAGYAAEWYWWYLGNRAENLPGLPTEEVIAFHNRTYVTHHPQIQAHVPGISLQALSVFGLN